MNTTLRLARRNRPDAEADAREDQSVSDAALRATDSGTQSERSGATDAVSGAPVVLSLDVVFELLKNQRRRLVFDYLTTEAERTTLSDLAEHIAASQTGKSVAAITSAERKRVYVALYQCHLPKLDEVGVIEFDQNRGTVVLADHAPQLSRYLDTECGPTGPPDRWSRYYLALSAVGSALFALTTVGGAGLGRVPQLLTAAVFLGIGGLAFAHRRAGTP